jgi:hypothetical protein
MFRFKVRVCVCFAKPKQSSNMFGGIELCQFVGRHIPASILFDFVIFEFEVITRVREELVV